MSDHPRPSSRYRSILLYVLRRVLYLLATFFIITSIIFLLVRSLVPAEIIYGPERELESARLEALGYNQPLVIQLLLFYKNIFLHWDFGVSLKISYLAGANELFLASLPSTLLVNLYAVILTIPIGIALGIFLSLHKGKAIDHIASVLMMIVISLPSFVLALGLQYLFGYKLGLPLTTSSLYDAGGSYLSISMLSSQILPVLALFLPSSLSLARFVRAEMVESLQSEAVTFARSLGIPRVKVIYHYAFKNALVPLLPMIFGLITGVFAGSVIIEQVFAIPGTGRLMLDALSRLDYDVFMACSMFYTFLGLLSGLLIDVTYVCIDPRIYMGGGRYNAR